MTRTLITVTDVLDHPIRAYNMGDVRIGDYSTYIPFRVWNNRRKLKKGIGTATGIRIILQYEPFPHHNALDSFGAIEGRCILSGETGSSVVDQFREFPLENTEYDTLESGQFNEYELRINLEEWPPSRNFIIEDFLAKVYIGVELDS